MAFQSSGIDCAGPEDDPEPEIVERALANIDSEVLVTGTSRRVGRDAQWWSAARRRAIPSLALLDHWTHYAERFTLDRPFDRVPDVIAVMDGRARRRMIDLGCPPDRIRVTGQPAFDPLVRDALSGRRDARHGWGLTDEAWVVLFASQPMEHDSERRSPYTERDALRLLWCALEGRPAHVIVRPHPREAIAALAKELRAAPVPAQLDDQRDRHASIAGADTVLGMTSILLVEAMLAGRAVASVQPVSGPSSDALPESIPILRTADELRCWLDLPQSRTPLTDNIRTARNTAAGFGADATGCVWDEIEALRRRGQNPWG